MSKWEKWLSNQNEASQIYFRNRMKEDNPLIYTSIASGSLWFANGIHAYIVGPRPKKDIIQKWINPLRGPIKISTK